MLDSESPSEPSSTRPPQPERPSIGEVAAANLAAASADHKTENKTTNDKQIIDKQEQVAPVELKKQVSNLSRGDYENDDDDVDDDVDGYEDEAGDRVNSNDIKLRDWDRIVAEMPANSTSTWRIALDKAEVETKRVCFPTGFTLHLIPLCISVSALTFTGVGGWDCTFFEGAAITFTGKKYGLWTLQDVSGKCQLWDVLFFNINLGGPLVTARVFSMTAMLLGLALVATMAQASQFHLASWGIGFALFLIFLVSLSTTSIFNVWAVFWLFTYAIMVLIIRAIFIHPVPRHISDRGSKIIAAMYIFCSMCCVMTLVVLRSDFCTCSNITSEKLEDRDVGQPCEGTCSLGWAGYSMVLSSVLWIAASVACLKFGIQPEILKENLRRPKEWYAYYPSQSIVTRAKNFAHAWGSPSAAMQHRRGETGSQNSSHSSNRTRGRRNTKESRQQRSDSNKKNRRGSNNSSISSMSSNMQQQNSSHKNNSFNTNNSGSIHSNSNHMSDADQEGESSAAAPESPHLTPTALERSTSSTPVESVTGLTAIPENQSRADFDHVKPTVNTVAASSARSFHVGEMEDCNTSGEMNDSSLAIRTNVNQEDSNRSGEGIEQELEDIYNTNDEDEIDDDAACEWDDKEDDRGCCQRFCCDYRVEPRSRKEKIMFWTFRSILGFGFVIYALFVYMLIGSRSENTAAAKRPKTTKYFTTPWVCAYNPDYPWNNFESFPTREAAKARNWTVAHCGKCGECSNPHDIRAYVKTRQTIAQKSKDCGVKVYLASFEDLVDCLQGKIGFTRPCTHCWADNMVNTGEKCLSTCMRTLFSGFMTENNVPGAGDQGWLNQCLFCDEKMSGPAFVTCSGVARRRLGIQSEIERNPVEQCERVDIDWVNVKWEDIGFDEPPPSFSPFNSTS